MNSLATAVSSAVKNPIVSSKSPRRESRKQAVPVVAAPAAAPVVATPKPKAEKVQKPETVFTLVSREALQASDFGKRLEAAKTDEKIHLNHNHQVLEAILSLKGNSFTLTDVISALDTKRYCDKHEKSEKLLRAYVLDNLEILAEKIPAGISRQ